MKKIIFMFLSMIFLCGCYYAKEPNNIAYVVAVGVDMTEDEGIYDYTIQFAKTTQISGGASEEGGKEGSEIVEVINVKAPTVYSAVNIANQIVSKNFTLAHTKLIVISEELAENGVRDLFDTFARNSDIRPNIYMAVSSAGAKEYLESVKPVAEINPVTYYRLIYESQRGGYVPRVLLKDFYFQIEDENRQNVLPLAGVNEKNKEKAKEGHKGEEEGHKTEDESNVKDDNVKEAEVNEKGFDFLTKKYYAGKIETEKRNASEVIGMALFDGEKMIGKMDNVESLIYNILRGEYKLSYTSFYNEKSPKVPVTIAIEQQRQPKISVKTTDGVPKIKIKIFMEGSLMSESTETPIELDTPSMEKQVEEETKQAIEDFLKRTQKEFGVDIIGFGQYAKSNFMTNSEYERYDWRSHYPEAEFSVDVSFEMQNIGFIDLGEERNKK